MGITTTRCIDGPNHRKVTETCLICREVVTEYECDSYYFTLFVATQTCDSCRFDVQQKG